MYDIHSRIYNEKNCNTCKKIMHLLLAIQEKLLSNISNDKRDEGICVKDLIIFVKYI